MKSRLAVSLKISTLRRSDVSSMSTIGPTDMSTSTASRGVAGRVLAFCRVGAAHRGPPSCALR